MIELSAATCLGYKAGFGAACFPLTQFGNRQAICSLWSF